MHKDAPTADDAKPPAAAQTQASAPLRPLAAQTQVSGVRRFEVRERMTRKTAFVGALPCPKEKQHVRCQCVTGCARKNCKCIVAGVECWSHCHRRGARCFNDSR